MEPTEPQPGKDSSSRSGSPENLDSIIATTKPQGWWALWSVTATMLVVLLWSFLGTLPQQTSAQGVVPTFPYEEAIISPLEGTIHFDSSLVNQKITSGAALATLTPTDGGPDVTIVAPVSGEILKIEVFAGQGVTEGETLLSIAKAPDAQKPLTLVAYVPASDAMHYKQGKTVSVTVTDFATSMTSTIQAQIADVANTPSSLDSMAIFGGSATLAEEWLSEASGTPYRIVMTITDWSSLTETSVPSPGQVVEIANVYGSIHPIDLLFGGK